jgi:pimeloyl-ACP methyl ester carboxylesterase
MTETYGMAGVEGLRLQVTTGITLNVVAGGPSDGRLTVLLHGFPECAYGWRRQIAPLAAAGLRVVAPDQRGYGTSDKPRGAAAYRLDALADDVLGIADVLGRQRFSLVGHDWGGVIAWHLAGRNPDRVERVAIFNAPHPATLRHVFRTHPSQLVRSWYFAFFQLPWLPEQALSAFNFKWLQSSLTRTARPATFAPADFTQYRRAWSQPGALTASLNWYRALACGAPPRSGRIRVPVGLVWGDRDPFLDRCFAEAGMAVCDYGKVFHLPEATHWLQHEEPEHINRLLLEFLA